MTRRLDAGFWNRKIRNPVSPRIEFELMGQARLLNWEIGNKSAPALSLPGNVLGTENKASISNFWTDDDLAIFWIWLGFAFWIVGDLAPAHYFIDADAQGLCDHRRLRTRNRFSFCPYHDRVRSR
jgi:hypothetical protein